MKLRYAVFFILCANVLYSQTIISGKITDKATNEPIPYASVYISNSERGTTTDEDGFFELQTISSGNWELIVSFLGYKPVIKKLRITSQKRLKADITLEKMAYDISTVEIVSKKSNKRKRYVKRFTKAFLGYTSNATKCTIVNPEVLMFTEEGGKLQATANDLIKVRNLSTGYEVDFLLEKFELQNQAVVYAGKPSFKPLATSDIKKSQEWEKERLATYNGSLRHFLTSLYNANLRKEGFKVHKGVMNNEGYFISKGLVSEKELIEATTNDNEKYLISDDILKVVYTREKGLNTTKSLEMSSQDYSMGASSSIEHQTSYLFLRKSKIIIHPNGLPKRPELLLEHGYWSNERIADLLPLEYKFLETSKEKQLSVLTKNGFQLNSLLIPIEEIHVGTKDIDEIPAIDQPKFIKAIDVKYLDEEDLVLGVKQNGIAKAYPIRILNWHEVVNDQFGDYPVVITYCPLCRSGIAFSSSSESQQLTFGVSGLLYNSDVLLYDKQTESLWSQILGKSISGKLSGKALDFIEVQQVTWADWKAQYPDTEVLSNETGFLRDYSKMPYTEYSNSEQLMFPVKPVNAKLKKKELVLGIEVDGKYKAYPFSALSKSTGNIKDEFQGKQVEIVFDNLSQTAKLVNGTNIKAVTLYWFAWYAFHTETEIYKN